MQVAEPSRDSGECKRARKRCKVGTADNRSVHNADAGDGDGDGFEENKIMEMRGSDSSGQEPLSARPSGRAAAVA